MSEQELKVELAKLLPDKIVIGDEDLDIGALQNFRWKSCASSPQQIKDTEWLHVCWLIECGMTDNEYDGTPEKEGYLDFLFDLVGAGRVSAAKWQHRAQAILKVKST